MDRGQRYGYVSGVIEKKINKNSSSSRIRDGEPRGVNVLRGTKQTNTFFNEKKNNNFGKYFFYQLFNVKNKNKNPTFQSAFKRFPNVLCVRIFSYRQFGGVRENPWGGNGRK